jgi:hypothetical protein
MVIGRGDWAWPLSGRGAPSYTAVVGGPCWGLRLKKNNIRVAGETATRRPSATMAPAVEPASWLASKPRFVHHRTPSPRLPLASFSCCRLPLSSAGFQALDLVSRPFRSRRRRPRRVYASALDPSSAASRCMTIFCVSLMYLSCLVSL